MIEYRWSTTWNDAGFDPGGSREITSVRITDSLTRTPTRTPYALNDIPSAQPRRSIFAIQVERRRYRGIVISNETVSEARPLGRACLKSMPLPSLTVGL